MPKLPLFVMANLHLVATGFRPAYLPLERENRARYPKIIEAAAALGLKTHVFEGLDQLAAGEFRGGSGLLVYNAAAADPKLIERVIGHDHWGADCHSMGVLLGYPEPRSDGCMSTVISYRFRYPGSKWVCLYGYGVDTPGPMCIDALEKAAEMEKILRKSTGIRRLRVMFSVYPATK
jgi:hypothetical protein